jgi:hypothetical protein
MISTDDPAEFAFDAERARDFAEEANDGPTTTGPDPVEHLISAGLRLGFLGLLPQLDLDLPAYNTLIQSILCSIPSEAFDIDGTLRFRRQIGQPRIGTDTPRGDVLIPGINFAKLRKRFG